MALTEVDEAELLRLRRLGETVGAMTKLPSAKRKLLEALKDVRPDDPSVKELERPDPIEQRFDELTKSNTELRKQIEDDKADREKNAKLDGIKRQQDEGFARLRQARWTDDGIAKVKAIMEEQGILNVEIAAKWIESQMPPPADPVTPGGYGAWNFSDSLANETDVDLKRLIDSRGENEGLLRKMAGEAINEVRGQSGARR
jgi:hypothetical protein